MYLKNNNNKKKVEFSLMYHFHNQHLKSQEINATLSF